MVALTLAFDEIFYGNREHIIGDISSRYMDGTQYYETRMKTSKMEV